MAEIFRLTLPREVPPTFPDCCIVCSRPAPGHEASLFAAEMRGGHSFLGGSYSLKVPCCVSCGIRLHARRLVSGLAPLLIVAGGIVLLQVLQSRTKSAGPIAWFAGAIALVAFVVWRVAFPPPFSVEPHDEFISFEFRDFVRAQEFRRLNPRCEASGSLTSA
jgi:hypothetical protein